MSPNFVHDLVEMAKAMETLPQVQAELDHAKLDQHNLSVEIDRLKADLEQSRNYAASLEQKVKTTEAERDDAELRFLELDEKTSRVLHWLEDVESSAKNIRQLVEPPKPQPEPEPVQPPVSEAVQSIEPQPQGQGESPPTNLATEPATSASSNDVKTSDADNTVSQDQGEVNPTAPADGNTAPSGTAEPKLFLPYANKSYRDHPVYVSYHDWIVGGGTDYSYYH